MQLSRGQLVLIISPKVRTRSILTVKPTFRFPPPFNRSWSKFSGPETCD